MAREIYRAKASFVVKQGNQVTTVRKGDTVRQGHEVMKGRQHLFELIRPRFETAANVRGKRKSSDDD